MEADVDDVGDVDHRVLGEARHAQEVVQLAPFRVPKPTRPVPRHVQVELAFEHRATVALFRLAIPAIHAVWLEHWHHYVSLFHLLHILSHALNFSDHLANSQLNKINITVDIVPKIKRNCTK